MLFLLAALAMAQPPLKIVLVGDSTVSDQGGWGPGFRTSLIINVTPFGVGRDVRFGQEASIHAITGENPKCFFRPT